MKIPLVLVNLGCDSVAFATLVQQVASHFPNGNRFSITDSLEMTERCEILRMVETYKGTAIVDCQSRQTYAILLGNTESPYFMVTVVPSGRKPSPYKKGYPFYVAIDNKAEEIVAIYIQSSLSSKEVADPCAV